MAAATVRQEEGNPLGTQPVGKLILRFAVPAIISFLVNAIYNIVDQVFLGWGVGMLGMAATNVSMPLVTICAAIQLLFGVGGASNFNLSLGRGDKEAASRYATGALGLLAAAGVIIAAVSFVFLEPMLVLFGATEQILPYAIPYTRIIIFGIPFLVFGAGATSLIRSDGSPRFAMVTILVGAVFNLIFDPIFLFVFDMGVEGIALATTLGQVLSCLFALYYVAKHFHTVPLKRAYLRPTGAVAGRIAALGMASFANQIAMTLVQVVMNNTLRHYGAQSSYGSDIPIAVVGAIAKLNIIFLAFTVGIAQGCQPIYGFNYGAKNYTRVKQTLKLAIISGTVFSTLAFLTFQLFPRQVMGIFGSGSEEYFNFAVMYLKIFMFMTFINALQPIISNFFSSIGKPRLGIIMSLTRQALFLIPLILILPRFFGIEGVIYAGPISDLAAAACSITFLVREVRGLTRLEQEQLAAPAPGPETAKA